MKKLLLLIILLIPLKVNASYIVMDSNSKRVLEGNNIHEKKLIASTTKIMSAIIAIENSDINKKVKVDKDVLKSYGSAIYIEVGEELTIKDLLYGLMLRSGNDAAIEIANAVSNSMDEFVKLMNDKAKELNMANTTFINNHGLENEKEEGNISTAYDMALLMRYDTKNDIFKEIIKSKQYKCVSSYKTYIWNNKNKLLDMYKYNIGGKTGYTKKAKRTLVTASSKDGKELIVVTLRENNDFNTHKNLYETNFKKYKLVTILNKNLFNLDDINYKGKVYIKDDYKMLLNKNEEDKVQIDYKLNKEGSYSNDDIVGYAHILLDNIEIDKIPLYLKTFEVKDNWFKKIIKQLFFWK